MDWLADIPLLPRVIATATLTYAYLVALIRVTGKRSVAQMNSFDWVVNVAVGSLSATAILTPEDSIEAWVAIGTIITLQVALTKATYHSDTVSALVKEEPSLIVRDGRMLKTAMADARINEDEVMAGVRSAGLSGLDEVGAMVFEADGKLSVIRADAAPLSPPLSRTMRDALADSA